MSNPQREAILRKLKEAAARTRAEREAEAKRREQLLANTPIATAEPEESDELRSKFGNITFNEQQMEAVELAAQGKELVLTGAAGTGKTTTVKAIISHLQDWLAKELDCTPSAIPSKSVLLCSFTNRAVKNIAKAVEDVNAGRFCSTIHKFLAFAPTEVLILDEETGEESASMRFMPQFDKDCPITECRLVIVEEASMVSVDLFKQLKDATPNAKYLFLGDLNQLPPVFGDAILGHKLNELPVVELSHVYRQAMDSPIVAFQHNFTLKGILPGDGQLEKITEESNGKLVFHPLKNEKQYEPELLARGLAAHMCSLFDSGEYHPSDSIILIPYNKSFGSIAMNKYIAQHISTKVNYEPTYEVIAGLEHNYFAVGDFVIFNKEEYVIEEITTNPDYMGSTPARPPSITMDRDGNDPNYTGNKDLLDSLDMSERKEVQDLAMLLKVTDGSLQEDVEELKAQASHSIQLRRPDWMEGGEGPRLKTRGDINKLEFGYAITIHKSQGSEWDRVFLIASNKHAPMLSRELLYTGMTRAKKELKVFYSQCSLLGKKDSSICKAIKRQTIPGKTWEEKAKYFFMKKADYQAKMDDTYEKDASND